MINLNSDIPIIGVKSDIAVVSIKPDSICTVYTGATTGLQNVGNGEGIIYKDQLGTKSLIRTIKQGNNITVITSGDTITINGIDSDNFVEVDDFIAHTGDTSIHYMQSGITINENQVNGLIGKYSLTGHTHSKEDLIGLKIADFPEFADSKITTLTNVTSGGIIPDTQWTWLNAVNKSVLSVAAKLIDNIYSIYNNTIFDVTLTGDTTNITIILPSTESNIVLEYGNINGTNNSDGSSSNVIINGIVSNNYIINASRLNNAFIYTGRYSTFGKMFLTRIGTGIFIEHIANSGFGTISSATYSNRNVIGQIDLPQQGINSILIIGNFKIGTNFKIKKQW